MKREDLAQLEDEALLRRAREDPASPTGRQVASELLGRHQQRVYVWCFRYVRDHERALDLSQEVLIKAYRSLESFTGRSRFSSWLFAITRNQCLSELRRPQILLEDEGELDELGDPAIGADLRLEQAEDEESLLELMAENLEPDEQDALWMRCVEKLPVDEITLLLSVQQASGARGLLQTARRKLRAALARQQEGGR